MQQLVVAIQKYKRWRIDQNIKTMNFNVTVFNRSAYNCLLKSSIRQQLARILFTE